MDAAAPWRRQVQNRAANVPGAGPAQLPSHGANIVDSGNHPITGRIPIFVSVVKLRDQHNDTAARLHLRHTAARLACWLSLW